MFSLADLSRAQGDCQTSLDLGAQMLGVARKSQDPCQLALAHCTLGETQVFLAAYKRAHEHFLEALTCYDPQVHSHLTLVTGASLGVMCLVWDSWVEWFLGRPDQAFRQGQKAVSLAGEIDHPFSLAFALALGETALHFLRREFDLAEEPIKELSRVVEQCDLPAVAVWAALFQG